MREFDPAALHIHRLRLRLPASGAEDGRRMAVVIAERLAAGLSPSLDRRLGGSSLRIRLDRRPSVGETATAVAGALTHRLAGSGDG